MPKTLSSLFFILLVLSVFPYRASAFRFVSWADSRGSSGVNTTTLTGLANQINALSVKPVLTIFGGDLENSGFTGSTSGAWTTSLGSLFPKTFPVRGNHDSSNEAGWVSYFNTRGNVAAIGGSNYNTTTTALGGKNGEDLTYSFDYENSRFILLDTPGDITKNLSNHLPWLESRLSDAQSNNNIVHVFIMTHGPVWAMGGHIITPPASLLTILDKYSKVSATFHGHEHIMAYAHISPADFSTYGLKNNSFEEFLTGNAGAPSYSCDTNRKIASGYHCGSYAGFATLDVNGADVTVNYYKLGSTTPTFTKSYNNNKTGVPTPIVTPTKVPTPTPTVVKPTPTPTFTPIVEPSTSTATPTPNPTGGSNTSINPSEDSYTFGGSTSTNYGSDTTLEIKNGSGTAYDRIAFLKFNLSNVSGTVSLAKLRMYVKAMPNSTPSLTTAFAISDDTWSESVINFGNMPVTGAEISPELTVSTASTWVEYDVTQYVNTELSGDKVATIAIQNATNSSVQYDSKEGTNKPTLVITTGGSSSNRLDINNDGKVNLQDVLLVLIQIFS